MNKCQQTEKQMLSNNSMVGAIGFVAPKGDSASIQTRTRSPNYLYFYIYSSDNQPWNGWNDIYIKIITESIFIRRADMNFVH